MSVTDEGDRGLGRASEEDAASGVSFGANVRDFFAWWRQELVSLTPGSWRNSLETRGAVATVQEVDGHLVLKTKPGVPAVPLVPGGKTPRGIPKPGVVLDEASIIAHCKAQIAGYKCPRAITLRTEPFPLSGAGKVLKRELRKQFVGSNAPAIS